MFSSSEATAMQENEAYLQLLIDCIDDCAIYMLDCSGHVISWNQGAEANTGYSSRETLGKHFRMFFLPEDSQAGIPERELSRALTVGRCAGEGWRRKRSGDRYWASFVLTAIRDTNGNLAGFAIVIKDISERKRKDEALVALEAALKEESERLQAAAESSMDALFFCEAVRSQEDEIEDFLFTYLNTNVEKLVTLPRHLMLGQRMCEILPFHRRHGLFEQYCEVVRTGKPLTQEITLRDDRLKSSWMRVQAVKFRDGLAITIADITEHKHQETRLLHMARHDALTGLPNRTLLRERILQGMDHADRYERRLAILMVDLDSFKQINDTFGHATGDRVLFTVADRLKAAVRASDSVIRIGGDEFVVVMPDVARMQDVEACAERILSSLRRPMLTAAKPTHVTCSIGAAIYPENATTVEDLLCQADLNMYAVKGESKNNIRFFRETRTA